MSGDIVIDLLIVLGAGLVAGLICRRLGLSMLIGYVVVGVFIGRGLLHWVGDEAHAIERLAEVGVFLLLFTIGLELSLDEIGRTARHVLVGGGVQMLIVAGVATAAAAALGMTWGAAFVIGSATALSSTVLVFKSLTEWGQAAAPHGRRAIAVLLFQDIALVPLLLLIPLLAGRAEASHWGPYAALALKSLLLVAGVFILRKILTRWIIPMLINLRSAELLVLFTLVVLGGVTFAAHRAGLPPALGALAAGLTFSGSRLAGQVEAVILPFREAFAAIFFVSLGLLFNPAIVLAEPLLLFGALAGILLLKAAAGAVALKLTGLGWKAAAGTGVGLAHLGEFSFVLILLGSKDGLLTGADYQRILCLALASLILTPQLLKLGLAWAAAGEVGEEDAGARLLPVRGDLHSAVVVGAGPVGRRVASQLETAGRDVCIIDLSPVNLHPFAQQDFRTVAGDATDPAVLDRAHVRQSQLIVVCVPDDQVAGQIVRAVRRLNGKAALLVRCRYQGSTATMRSLGADTVVSEEVEVAGALSRVLQETAEE